MINLLSLLVLTFLLISIILIIIEQVLRVKSNKNYMKELVKIGNMLKPKNKQLTIQQLIDTILKINAIKGNKKIVFILDGNKEEVINFIFMKLVASSVEVYKAEEIESINCDNYAIICNITVNT